MDVLLERACGLDVHKKSITACMITPEGKEIQTFPTATMHLTALVDWVKEKGCTHVAMESTGVLWKPIVNLMEAEELTVMVVNAQHIKAVPGRKTDVKDAEWIADLLRHGLLKPSFIPDRKQRELRELVRYRRSLVQERAREVNRLHKVLEGANIKLGAVISDILGVSGRDMLEALANGEEDPGQLASLARRRMKNKREELERALQGTMSHHQRLMIKTMLAHIDQLAAHIEQMNQEVANRLAPFEEDLERLDSIPGIGRQTAEQILSEIGTQVGTQFPSSAHLCSWLGLVPGQNESAGKRKASKARPGNKYIRAALIESAHSLKNTNTFLGAMYRRIARRRGNKRAAVAVAHAMMKIAYHMLTRKEMYHELGADFYEQRKKDDLVKQHRRRLEMLGYKVTLEAVEQEAS